MATERGRITAGLQLITFAFAVFKRSGFLQRLAKAAIFVHHPLYSTVMT